jgi:hypothetical protein
MLKFSAALYLQIINMVRNGAVISQLNFFLNSGLWGYWQCGHSWPVVPASGDSEDDYGEADGM